MKNRITAKQFFKEIEKEQNKYKLVNGLFIVKYLNKEICVLIAEFDKKQSALNQTNTNKIKLTSNGQEFNKKLKLTKTRLNIWKPLNIAFKEKPIKEILI